MISQCVYFVLWCVQVQYGGHGYAHILENIVPKMEQRGISRDTAMKILTENPQNWLTFA